MLYIKQYKYADKDIKKLTGSIIVLVDTREKQNRHITDYLDKNNIAYEPTTLSYGDYSFYIPAEVAGEDIYFHRDIVIERKASNTQFAPVAFMASLKAWEARFNCNVQFIDKQYSGYYIMATFQYYAREMLK